MQYSPVLTNLNVTLLCDLMVSLNEMWVQSFKIPDEVAIILFWSEFLLLEVPPPLAAPPLRQLLNKLRCDFVTVSKRRNYFDLKPEKKEKKEKWMVVISVCSNRLHLKITFLLGMS